MTERNSQQVTIVGAGLVGSLTAIILARRGFEVTVYERRPDIRRGPVAGGRSINLVLTTRGLRTLALVGLDRKALELTVRVTGRMIHSLEGQVTYQPYGRDETECNYSISRAGLNQFLIDEADSAGVTFRFERTLAEADLEKGRLVFHDEADRAVDVDAPIVLGTDGVASAARASFVRGPDIEESIQMLEYGYKELVIPAAGDGSFVIEGNALHIWPRGDSMMMALPNLDGSFTVTLYMRHRGAESFESIDTPESVERLFRERFPDAVSLIPRRIEDYFANPAGELGTVRCRPWYAEGRLLLIGDAAHAIVPFFGQGMNLGFEDCRVLDEMLDASSTGDLRTVFAEFSAVRKPDADAIADMALENFVEMRDRVADSRFLLRKQVDHELELKWPGEYRTRYSMVMYSHIPFNLAQRAGRIQDEILDTLCDGLDVIDRLDLELARRLIRERLAPFLDRNGIRLDY